MANRLQAAKNPRYRNGFNLSLHPDLLNVPRHWRKGRMVFVNSMSDLFHKDVPLEFIRRVFHTMNECPQHQFQILTKRSGILASVAPSLMWTDNIWAGVTVEDANHLDRVDDLRSVPAKVRWISFEPLLGRIGKIDLNGIHWVVVGGESGAGFRPMETDWVRELRDQCVAQAAKFFFKQYAGVHPRVLGSDLDGKEWKEKPDLNPQLSLFAESNNVSYAASILCDVAV